MRKATTIAATVMLLATGAFATVSDHVLKIEISSTYNYGQPGDTVYYAVDACIQVDGGVVSGSLLAPDGNTYPLDLDVDDERWLSFYLSSHDLAELSDFMSGTYTFTVTYADSSTDSTSIHYAMPDGSEISPVTQQPQLTYPAHNSTDVPLQTVFRFVQATDANWEGFGLEWKPQDDFVPALSGEAERLSGSNQAYGPVYLSPDTLYCLYMSINNAVRTVNADAIPAVLDKDSEAEFLFTTASESSSHPFWPMQVGQTWTYQATDNDANSWTMTFEIDGKTSINGKEYFQLTQRNFDNDGEVESFLARVTDEALYTWDDDLQTETMDFILAPLGTITRSFDGTEWEYRVVDRYETVSLGSLGTFEALVYHKYPSDDDGSSGYPQVNRTVYFEEYIVPGFGFIKMFDTWFSGPEGPVPAYAPVTYVLTDISPSVDFCGIIGRPYPEGDLNQDCIVNMVDVAISAANWLVDSK